MLWMDGKTLSQNSGYNSKCFASNHVTVASCQALQAVFPNVRGMAGMMGEEVRTLLRKALGALNSGRSWEPFNVLEKRLILLFF